MPVSGSQAQGEESPLRGGHFSATHESGFAKRNANETATLDEKTTARVEKTILKGFVFYKFRIYEEREAREQK